MIASAARFFSVFYPIYQLSKDCKSMAELKQIFSQIILTGIHSHSPSLAQIISFSATSDHGDLNYAFLIFTQMENPNTFMWNSMIMGFIKTKNTNQALQFYTKMNKERSMVDRFTFPFVLKACSLLMALEIGRAVHGQILQMGFSSDPFIQSSLIRMYSEFGTIDVARQLFDEIRQRDIILWNSMIGGYLKCGLLVPAEELFDEMPEKNIGTFNAMIDGNAKLGSLEIARRIFDEMPERDAISWNTMMGALARCGSIAATRKLFDEMPRRNVASWSAIISGFTQCSEYKEALEMFSWMLKERVKPNQAILVSVLSSCAYLGTLEQGIWVHGYIDKNGIELDDVIGSSLIDMYCKCGLLQGGISVFDKILKKDVYSWTSMIYGFAIHGLSLKALDLLSEMERKGIKPNDITFVAVLCACSHAGFVDRGLQIFDRMYQVYNIKPKIEHYGCIVDLLSRANRLDEAKELIKRMPMEPDIFVWGALLSGFKKHVGDYPVDEHMSMELAKLEPKDSGTFVLMSNMYASIDQWDDVARLRKKMIRLGVQKNPGCSSIEVNKVVHEFLAGGRLHPQSHQIYAMLDQVYQEMKFEGFHH